MLLCLFQWRTLPIFLTFSWGHRDHHFISLWFRKNKGLFAPVMIYPTLVVGSELFCLLWSFCLFSFSLPCALWGLNDKVDKKGLWNQIWAWILALPFMCLGSRVLKCTTSLSTLALIMYLEICIPQYHCEGQVSSVQFSHSVVSNSLWPHESQHARPPCPSPTPGVCSNSFPLSQWCHPAISSSVVRFSSCPQSLPASGSFPMSQLFTWGGQSIGFSASASVLPMNIQDWSPLGWTGWISLGSQGLSRVLFNTIVQNHHFLDSFPHSPTLTSTYDQWINHSLDQTDLCWQSNVSAFQYAI